MATELTTITYSGGTVKDNNREDGGLFEETSVGLEENNPCAEQPEIKTTFSKDAELVLHTGLCQDFMSDIPDGSIKLIITSPPYNLNKAYEVQTALDEYLEGMLPILSELVRVLNDEGSICWQIGNHVKDGEVYPLDMFFYPLFKKLGLKLRNRIIWHFGHGLHANKRFSGRYETILWFTKGNDYTFNLDPVRVPSKYPGKRHFKGKNKGKPSCNPLGKNPSDTWEFVKQEWDMQLWDIPNVKAHHPEKTAHPCQFPVELVERCVLALTNEDDWVFDPFCGVGSSLLGAALHNRRAAGCDKENKYTDVAISRIGELYDGKLKRRPVGTLVYKPKENEKVAQIPEEWLNKKVDTDEA